MTTRSLSVVLLAALAILTAAGAATGAASADPGAAYCRAKGGTVQLRSPAYGTNDPASQIVLGTPRAFCKFRAADGSRIYAATDTLHSRKPTLAALAYLTKPAAGSIPGGVNPASVYCTRLGGSDLFGGVNAGGGGWVSKADRDDPVVQACVFPDLSIIDSFGLFYHADGVIRGANLTPILRYHPASPPALFGR